MLQFVDFQYQKVYDSLNLQGFTTYCTITGEEKQHCKELDASSGKYFFRVEGLDANNQMYQFKVCCGSETPIVGAFVSSLIIYAIVSPINEPCILQESVAGIVEFIFVINRRFVKYRMQFTKTKQQGKTTVDSGRSDNKGSTVKEVLLFQPLHGVPCRHHLKFESYHSVELQTL